MERRRARSPGVVYTGISVALVVAFAAFALTTRQPPPPTIAEFAPQAVERIEDAPDEQTSTSGSADGAVGRRSTESKQAREVIEVARVRRCVGDPPRQIEDPQSPPCVPFWRGDNGGATARGVTAGEIRVMVPTPQNRVDFFEALETFINTRFELYGRKVRFFYGSNTSSAGSANPDNQKAEAVSADEEYKVFATIQYRSAQGHYYHQELARRGVVNATVGLYDREYLEENDPYMWGYVTDSGDMFSSLGAWACRRLAGRNAAHAGDAGFKTRKRMFGIFLQDSYDDVKTDVSPLEAELRRCGSPSRVTLINPIRTGSTGSSQATGLDPSTTSSAILRMKQAGVTSLFCLCQAYAAGGIMKSATSQSYFPEWLVSTYGGLDINGVITSLVAPPPDQMANAFGVTFQPRQIRPANEPYLWAAREADPAFRNETDSLNVAILSNFYRPMLLLASGLQMAGPRLTAETFAEGLRRTAFPNPDHPNMAGDVGFAPSRASMTLDGAEFWWSNTAPSPYTPSGGGTFCYANGGSRHQGDDWPSGGDSFFGDRCDSGA